MLLFEKTGVENTEKALELALSAAKVKVTALTARAMADGHATLNIVVEVRDKTELDAVIHKLNVIFH